MEFTQKIEPCLWFDGVAEEAAGFYTSIFPNSTIVHTMKSGADWPAGKAGDTILVTFTLAGMRFLALNGGPDTTFDKSISLSIACDDQAEVDRYWAALTSDDGEPIQCGWLKDKFGLHWQVVPKQLMEMMHDADPERVSRVMTAMFDMVKLDLPRLRDAYDG